MNYLRAGGFGLVLDSGDPRVANFQSRLADRKRGVPNDEVRAHIVVDRYTVDADGNICLTPSVPLRDLASQIELFRVTLEALVSEAKERCADVRSEMSRGPVRL